MTEKKKTTSKKSTTKVEKGVTKKESPSTKKTKEVVIGNDAEKKLKKEKPSTSKKKKEVSLVPTKAQQKVFDRVINNVNFVKKRLINQVVSGKMVRILDINETKVFVVIDNEYFLYNESTKALRELGRLFDKSNPPRIEHSKDIPWDEV